MTPKHPCAFPGCEHGADPRWGGYCDGHGATTEREVENRHSAIVAIATEAVDLRAQVAALREQRRVLRANTEAAISTIELFADPSCCDAEIEHDDDCLVGQTLVALQHTLDATKEEP